MDRGRRLFVRAIAAALGAAGALRAALAAQQTGLPPREEPERPKHDPEALLKLRQKEVQRHVARLAELAEELKKEAERTDSARVLSLQLVRRAEEIEKLAKNIKNLARGL